jgi:hypothetical protein
MELASIVLHSSVKAKIEAWIDEAPDLRRVEIEPLASDAWESRAIEGGQVLFEEVDVETDEPVLRRLGEWCAQQLKLAPRPPVKTNGIVPAPTKRTA